MTETNKQEKALIFIKPDGMANKAAIKEMLYEKVPGLQTFADKIIRLTREQVERHYAHHANKPFFNDLVEFIISEDINLIIVEGRDAINRIRDAVGATDPAQADKGTIRNTFGESKVLNVMHASDSVENALKEIANLFFNTLELKTDEQINEALSKVA